MTDETKRLYEKKPDRYEINPLKDSIDYLLPEWVSNIKKYFEKYQQNDHHQ